MITEFPKTLFGYKTFAEREYYKKAWRAFELVYQIHLQAEADLAANKPPFPYKYPNFEEKSLVIFGQQLHVQAYPQQDWSLSSLRS
jgi:hypothetical protein